MQILKGESVMMYIHYCKKCNTLRMLSGHKSDCPACEGPLHELSIPFEQYSRLTQSQRTDLLNKSRKTYL